MSGGKESEDTDEPAGTVSCIYVSRKEEAAKLRKLNKQIYFLDYKKSSLPNWMYLWWTVTGTAKEERRKRKYYRLIKSEVRTPTSPAMP